MPSECLYVCAIVLVLEIAMDISFPSTRFADHAYECTAIDELFGYKFQAVADAFI